MHSLIVNPSAKEKILILMCIAAYEKRLLGQEVYSLGALLSLHAANRQTAISETLLFAGQTAKCGL